MYRLVLFTTLLMAAGSAGATPNLAGIWQGKLSVTGITLTIILNIKEDTKNSFTASMSVPEQGAQDLPADTVEQTGQKVRIEFKGINGVFEGTFSKNGKQISGNWTQNSNTLPLTLKRTSHPEVLVRPQIPKPPFPYKSKEVTIKNSSDSGVTLSGTLTIPEGKGPFPAILLIAGSGPNNRDENVLGHPIFLVLADHFTRSGFAVLRCDKRGIGKSTGNYAVATTMDFASDAEAEVNYLHNLPEVSPGNIFLIGHSEGGVIAPIVATKISWLAGIVLLAGTGEPGNKILSEQARLIAAADGETKDQINQNSILSKSLYAILKNEADPVKAAVEMKKAFKRNAAGKLMPEAQVNATIEALNSPWMRFFLFYDPQIALRKVRCPVLAVDGSLDLQVPPVKNLKAITEGLKKGDDKDVTTHLFPGLNHLFQPCKTGSPIEYAQIPTTFSPEAMEYVTQWLKEHVRK